MIVFNYSGNPSNVGMGFGFFFTDVKRRQVQMIHTTQRFFFTFDDVICYPAHAALLFPQRNFIFLCSISIETNYYLKKKKTQKISFDFCFISLAAVSFVRVLLRQAHYNGMSLFSFWMIFSEEMISILPRPSCFW